MITLACFSSLTRRRGESLRPFRIFSRSFFYMGIADSEQRQCRCSKDVFGLEAVHLSAFQLLDKPRGGFLVIEQVQVSLSRGIVMLFRFGQPLDLDLLAHGLTSPLWIDQRRHQWDQYPT